VDDYGRDDYGLRFPSVTPSLFSTFEDEDDDEDERKIHLPS